MARLVRGASLLILLVLVGSIPGVAAAQSDTGPIMRLLKSGRLPKERLGNVVDLVCQRGNAEDLAYIFELVTKPDGIPADVRLKALSGLTSAAETRKVQPAGDLTALAGLIEEKDAAVRLAAVRLAGAWKVESLAPALAIVITSEASSPAMRQVAIDSVTQIGGAAAESLVGQLLNSPDVSSQALGIAALAGSDIDQAASKAADVLARLQSMQQAGIVLDAFLAQQQGSDKLAAALAGKTLGQDAAKLALRHVYSVGRSDAALVAALSQAAGIATDRPPLTPQVLEQLVASVTAKGDPKRGEEIFRRADLSCMKCHAVSGAGGEVGPDLSPLGATSPVDYVINSILLPDLSIKEAFLTKKLLTSDGKIYQGIVVDRNDQQVVIKQATGERVTVPVADIDEEAEGQSLMPKGLASLLTEDEFLDLVRFLSELGKPGEYAVRSQPTIQRWHVLTLVPPKLASAKRNDDAIKELGTLSHDAWQPTYAKVNGELPLEPLAHDGVEVLWLRADIEATEPGEVELKLFPATSGISAWLEGKPLSAENNWRANLAKGSNQLLLQMHQPTFGASFLRALIEKPPGSPASYNIVGGR